MGGLVTFIINNVTVELSFFIPLCFCRCCFYATWELCARACGVMESPVRKKSATPSPGFAPGLPVQTAPSDSLSSSTRPQTCASESLCLGFISATWRTAVKERVWEHWKTLACTSQSWVTKVRDNFRETWKNIWLYISCHHIYSWDNFFVAKLLQITSIAGRPLLPGIKASSRLGMGCIKTTSAYQGNSTAFFRFYFNTQCI